MKKTKIKQVSLLFDKECIFIPKKEHAVSWINYYEYSFLFFRLRMYYENLN